MELPIHSQSPVRSQESSAEISYCSRRLYFLLAKLDISGDVVISLDDGNTYKGIKCEIDSENYFGGYDFSDAKISKTKQSMFKLVNKSGEEKWMHFGPSKYISETKM